MGVTKRPNSAFVSASVFAAMALSLVALLLVSGQRYRWLEIGSEAGTGYGYGYEVEVINAASDVIVSGATASNGSRKTFVVEISNRSTNAISVDPSQEIHVTVTVNGSAVGDLRALSDEVTISPDDTSPFRIQWLYEGFVSRGDAVVYSACVDVPGDTQGGDDCDSETVIAR